MGSWDRNENEISRWLKMDRMRIIAGMLIMLALAGMPAGVQAEGDDGIVAADIWRKRI